MIALNVPRPSAVHRHAVAEQLDATERCLLAGGSLADATVIALGSSACDERPTLLPEAS